MGTRGTFVFSLKPLLHRMQQAAVERHESEDQGLCNEWLGVKMTQGVENFNQAGQD